MLVKLIEGFVIADMGGCQNHGPFLGPYYNKAPII